MNISETYPFSAEDDERVTMVTVTCSLVSSRMSPNQTHDDLPGAGRTIDTYFYQPSGHFLEELINRFLAKRQLRKEQRLARALADSGFIGIIDNSFSIIQTFFSSKFSLISDEHVLKCRYLRWTSTGQKSTFLDLSEYLYAWGAQDIADWDVAPILEHCACINNFVSATYSRKVRARALSVAFCLLSSFPRLRTFFDLELLYQAGRNIAISYDAFYHIIFQTYDVDLFNRKDIVDMQVDAVFDTRLANDDVFRYLTKLLPTTKITIAGLSNCRRVLLEFIFTILKQHEYALSPLLKDVFDALLFLSALFQFSATRFNTDDAVAKFWERVKVVLDTRLAHPSVKLKSGYSFLFMTLQMRLMDTLLSLPLQSSDERVTSPGNQTESIFMEEFVRRSFDVLLRLLACDRRSNSGRVLKSDGSWINEGIVSKAKVAVDSRTAIGKNRIDTIWEECRSDFIRQLRSKPQPRK